MKKDIKWVSLTGKRIFKFGNWTRCEYIRSYTQNSYSKHYSIQFLKMLVCFVCLMWIVLRGFFFNLDIKLFNKTWKSDKIKKQKKTKLFSFINEMLCMNSLQRTHDNFHFTIQFDRMTACYKALTTKRLLTLFFL